MAVTQYFGKYRAKVVDVKDPEKRGRIRVMCPKVLGDYKSSWCEPCIPFAYENGGDFHIPKLNDFVWVEFEEGDHNRPIWVGSLWTVNNTSLNTDYTVNTRVIEFDGGRVEMTRGNILITIGGSQINLTSGGTIDVKGKAITLNGSSSVSLQGGSVNLN